MREAGQPARCGCVSFSLLRPPSARLRWKDVFPLATSVRDAAFTLPPRHAESREPWIMLILHEEEIFLFLSLLKFFYNFLFLFF